MITRIEAYKYRCFEKLEVSFENFHVLVGSNGSGKTTLLDIPTLVADMLRVRRVDGAFFERMPSRLRARADSADDLILNQRGEFFAIVIEAKLPQEVTSRVMERWSARMSPARAKQLSERSNLWPEILRYELQCEKFNETIQVGQEHLLLLPRKSQHLTHGRGLVGESLNSRSVFSIVARPRGEPAVFAPLGDTKKSQLQFRLEPSELALANVPADQEKFAAALWFRTFLTRKICFYQPNVIEMHNASPPRARGTQLAPDGSTLPWLIIGLKAGKNRRAFNRWLTLVRLAVPNIKDIMPVVREDDRAAYFKILYANGSEVPSSSASDGTLSILALTILPYLESLPELITIEEPENGVHPKAIQAIVEALSSVSDAQVWLSSHSPVVLANAELKSILCLSQVSDGTSIAIPGDKHPGLSDWQGAVDLGTLFAAGVLS